MLEHDVKTYTTDANGANAELQSIINSTFSGYSLANETSYTLSKIQTQGKKELVQTYW